MGVASRGVLVEGFIGERAAATHRGCGGGGGGFGLGAHGIRQNRNGLQEGSGPVLDCWRENQNGY